MTLYRVKQNKIEAAGNETEQLGKGTQPDDITDIFPEKKIQNQERLLLESLLKATMNLTFKKNY